MKNNIKKKLHTSDNDKAHERVAELVRSLLDESLSPEIHEKLKDWFAGADEGGTIEQMVVEAARREAVPNEHPDAEEYRSLARIIKRLGLEPSQASVVPLKRRSGARRVMWRVAAVMIPFIALAGGYFAGWFTTDSPQGTTPGTLTMTGNVVTVEAVEGVQKDMVLADQTRIWVNGGSKVTYPEEFADGQRDVKLEGEAFFEVAKDEGKPFVVHTENLSVKVLGTKFNVAEDMVNALTVVTLLEGSVEVMAAERSERLVPGERLTYRHATAAMNIEKLAPAEQDQGDWRTDAISANRKTIAEILSMIGNYYDVDLVFDTVSFPGSRFTIDFNKSQPIENVLEALSKVAGGGFSYEIQDDDTIKIYN